MPRFRSITELSMKSGIRRIGAVSRFAYGEAVSKNLPMALELNLDDGTYRATLASDVNDDLGGFNEAVADVVGALGQTNRLPDGVYFKEVMVEGIENVIEEGEARIIYKATGRVDTAVIHLIDDFEHEWTLVVHPLTGRIKVYEGYEEFLIQGVES